MNSVTVTRIVRAPLSEVWAEVSDVTTVVDWHPAVRTVDLLSDRPTGLDAARRCNFHDGTSVVERVVAIEEGRRLKLVLSEFSMPIHRFEAEITLSESSDGTQVTFVLSYEMKYGVLGSLMNALMVKGQMAKLMGSVLGGLDHHVRTGEIVGADFVAAA